MLIIRLQRTGRKHEPVYRLVLTDSKNGPQSGKFLEILGHFDARHSEKSGFKSDRIKHWIGKGVQLSDTVHNLMVNEKIIEGEKINKLPKKTATKKTDSTQSSTEPKKEVKIETETPEITTKDAVENESEPEVATETQV